MKSRPLLLLSLAGAALLWTAASSLYTIGQAQQALVLRFGEPTRVLNAGGATQGPGLYAKWPLAERVLRYDRRTLTLQGEPTEATTADGGRIKVASALSYRIVDPLQAYGTEGGDDPSGGERLRSLLQTSVSRALGAARLQDVVSDGGASLTRSALLAARHAAAADRLGVQITDVSLAAAVSSSTDVQAIGRRMQEEETRQAAQVRLDGETHKREAIALADREAMDIRSDAERQALDIRGGGDAQRADILGVAYGKDPEFARFFRRLEAYDQALNPDNTVLVLSPDNAFLDLFGHGPVGAPKPR